MNNKMDIYTLVELLSNGIQDMYDNKNSLTILDKDYNSIIVDKNEMTVYCYGNTIKTNEEEIELLLNC